MAIIPAFAHGDGEQCHDCGDIIFIENKNQWEPQINFKVDLRGGALFVEDNALTFTLYDMEALELVRGHGHGAADSSLVFPKYINGHAYQLQFEGANPNAFSDGHNKVNWYYNYFLGNDKSKWAGKVKGYKAVGYHELYPGIDMELYSRGQSLKYDFIVSPGADAANIQMSYNGLEGIKLKKGHLLLKTSVAEIKELAPYAYQIINGEEVEVTCEFVLHGETVSFELPQGYNKAYPLVIDPTIVFSTFSGSTADNFGYTATFDSDGNLYAGGSAFNNGYPVTLGAFQTTWAGGTGTGTILGSDMAITKYSSNGSTRLYSTYLGGNSDELPHSFFVNSNDELFVFGTTSSPNFPTTTGAYDETFNGGPSTGPLPGLAVDYINGSDIVVARFRADGTDLIASTFLGGTDNDGLNLAGGLPYNYADEVRGEIIIDGNDNVYVVSSTISDDYPIAGTVFQTSRAGMYDGCITKLDNNLSTLIWSSYLGGSESDGIYSIDLDSDDNVFVTGGTRSTDFPVTATTLDQTFNGLRADGYVTHIAKNGQLIINSTYYGTSTYDQGFFVELDNEQNVYILGQTKDITGFYIFNALYNQPNSGQYVSKLTYELDSVIWSTAFGNGTGEPDISPTAFLVDVCSKIYMSGWGGSTNGFGGTSGLDITPDALQSTTDNSDFYLLVIEDDASSISYGTYFGGPLSSEHVDGGTSRFDQNGVIYQSVCAGCGNHDDFPIYPHPDSVVSATNNSFNCNNGVFKFDFNLPIVLADFERPPVECVPFTATFTNTSTWVDTAALASWLWVFGDGTTSTAVNPTHTYTSSGVYDVTLIAIDPASCNGSDTITKQMVVLANGRDSLATDRICPGTSVQIGLGPSTDTSLIYSWSPSTYLSATNIPNPFSTPPVNMAYTLLVSNGLCTDTLYQEVEVVSDDVSISGPTELCTGSIGTLTANNLIPGDTLSYSWNADPSILSPLDSQSIVIAPTALTTYVVTAVSPAGCVYRDSFTVDIRTFLNMDSIPTVRMCGGDSMQIGFPPLGIPGATYSWTPTTYLINPDSTNPIAYPPTTTVFQLIAQDGLCIDTLTQQLGVLSDSIYASSSSAVACNGDTLTLNATNFNSSWPVTFSWSPTSAIISGATTASPEISPASPTTYTVVATNAQGCTYTDDIFIDVSSINFDITATAPSICAGETTILTANDLGSTDPITIYNWSPAGPIISGAGTNMVTAQPASNTTFTLLAENSAGCTATETISITVIESGLDTLPDVISCDLNPVQIGITDPGDPTLSFSWLPTTGLSDPGIPNPFATVSTTTTYVLQVSNSVCIDTFVQTVIPYTDSIYATADGPVCVGQAINLSANNTNTANTLAYSWIPSAVIISGQNEADAVAQPTDTTWFIVTATNSVGCVYTDTVRADVISNAVIVTAIADPDTIGTGGSSTLSATSPTASSFVWSPGTDLNTTVGPVVQATPTQTITYNVVGTDPFGCEGSDSVTIYYRRLPCGEGLIYVPNGFTPNDDGKNDILYVRGNEMQDMYFAVYDRWGQKVFETTDPLIGWDGTFKGSKLDPAVYAFYVEATCPGEEKVFLKGNVTLIR